MNVAHDRSPRVLHVASGSPEICTLTDPLSTSIRISTIFNAFHNVATSLFVAIVKALLKLDPARVFGRPLSAPTVVCIEESRRCDQSWNSMLG
eukprot:SAG31_NODE_770_length_12217_cov_2.855174_13_plen_93_part_00